MVLFTKIVGLKKYHQIAVLIIRNEGKSIGGGIVIQMDSQAVESR